MLPLAVDHPENMHSYPPLGRRWPVGSEVGNCAWSEVGNSAWSEVAQVSDLLLVASLNASAQDR